MFARPSVVVPQNNSRKTFIYCLEYCLKYFFFQLFVFCTQLYDIMFENPYTTICFPYTTICFGTQLSVFRTQLYGFRTQLYAFRTQLYGFRTQHIPTLFSVHNYMFETMFVS